MTGPVREVVLPLPLQVLCEACGRYGYGFEIVDRFAGSLVRVTGRAGAVSFLSGAGTLPSYPGNDMVLAAVARDKAHAAALLQQGGFAVPEGRHFFLSPYRAESRPAGRELADALAYAEALSAGFTEPVVCKPNSGARARDVALAWSAEEVRQRLATISRSDPVCLIQRLVRAPEYRLFLVGGEIAFCYAKRRPSIVGDGRSRIADLLRPVGGAADRYVAMVLADRGLTPDQVLASGERLETGFVANISAAGSLDGLVEPAPAVHAWAKALHRCLPLAVMGLDVFSPSRLADPADFIVTDVNGSPALATLYELGEREVVLETWRRIIERHFAGEAARGGQGSV